MRGVLFLLFFLMFGMGRVQAQAIVLDAETMEAFAALAAPVQKAMPTTAAARFLLVQGDDINAFADGEDYVHLYSGLVLKARNNDEIQGVLAHELGHIAAQHITRMEHDVKEAQWSSMAGAILGIGAAVAGAPQAGTALILGGQAGAISNLLAHSRIQEQEADRRAVDALHTAGISAAGMVGMFETLRTESQLSLADAPPYLQTHPLPQDRLENLERLTLDEKGAYKKVSAPLPSFERLQAKVFAMTRPPMETLRKYASGKDFASRYAVTLATLKQGKLTDAARMGDALAKELPHDVYVAEMRAQIALEQGKLAEAEVLLAGAVKQKPTAPILRFEWAEVLRNENKLSEALPQFQRLTREWQDWPAPWKSMALVLGNQGQLAHSQLALAQASVFEYDPKEAQLHLDTAKHYMKEAKQPAPDDAVWAESLKRAIERLKANAR